MPLREDNPISALTKADIESMLANDVWADRLFDKLLPQTYQKLSSRQWTPSAVVRRVAQLLENVSGRKIIDIGSGVGKFCILLGIFSDLEIFGIEQRRNLFEVSENIRNQNLLKRVTFINGNMVDLPWEDFDILYLYNPFQEHLLDNGWTRIDKGIRFDPGLFAQYTDEIFRQLAWAQKGKLLITYHGYGGIVPSTWNVIYRTNINGGELCMWEKVV
jgi:SAM-dependent methyltransferase